jgi:Outer membrane protein beta-barrel domain
MRLWSVVGLVCACAAIGQAQVGEASLSFGETLMKDNVLGMAANLTGTQYKVGDGFRVTARFTLNTRRFIGHEFGYGYSRTTLGAVGFSGTQSMPTHQGFYDFLLYGTPEGSKIRPFITGGAQFTTFVPPGGSVYSGTTKYGGNFGAGIKVKTSPMFMLRLDVRDYAMGKPFDLINQSGTLHDIEVTAGFGIHF